MLIQRETYPSTDFEPEYIAVSGNTAYISLQEANAVAVLDIALSTFTGVYPLGFQDYGTIQIDLQKNDTIGLQTYPNVYGIKMPDGISVAEINGQTYLFTANEGDSRSDWAGLDNEYENKISLTGNMTLDKKSYGLIQGNGTALTATRIISSAAAHSRCIRLIPPVLSLSTTAAAGSRK